MDLRDLELALPEHYPMAKWPTELREHTLDCQFAGVMHQLPRSKAGFYKSGYSFRVHFPADDTWQTFDVHGSEMVGEVRRMPRYMPLLITIEPFASKNGHEWRCTRILRNPQTYAEAHPLTMKARAV